MPKRMFENFTNRILIFFAKSLHHIGCAEIQVFLNNENTGENELSIVQYVAKPIKSFKADISSCQLA